VWRQTGKQPKQLAEAVTVPELATHVWGWFCQLHNERGSNGMEQNKITADRVKDWCWFNGVVSLELWERQAIRALDNCWFMLQRKAK
jgi:hypothetical protein